MEENLLKGNFQVKKPVKAESSDKQESVKEKLREKALGTLGGSMVYMERNNLVWDGDS